MMVRGPGPGTYNAATSIQRYNNKLNGLGRVRRFEERSIDASVEKDFIAKDTPGPGSYEFSSSFK